MKAFLLNTRDMLENENPLKSTFIGFIMGFIVVMGAVLIIGSIANHQLIGEYKKDEASLYHAWYDIHIERPQNLVEFKEPYVEEWGITAKYQYAVEDSVIESEYNNIFQKLNWSLENEIGRTKTYIKDNLICDLTELDDNMWEVKIHVKGYHDKGFWEKLIHGNTKPKVE